ncbi:LysE family translocator [Roseomonas sp. 18066]|uniref:LysE family translocator n=1 Tax=Roseomonas sp. 18066 TaxID=2681412 RepID=UPI0013577E6E|nr:LysE family translocator [Roseomonas sp. 18066]
MPVSSLLVFATAYAAALLLPGPGVTALVARVLARGPQGVLFYIAGFIGGALAWFTIAATGLAALAQGFADLFLAIRYAGAAYLLWLAVKFWRAPALPGAGVDRSPEGAARLFLAGLALNLGNPKVILFFLALLPGVVPLERLTPAGFLQLAGLIVLIAGSVLAGYAVLAARARRLFATPRAMRLLNRGSSLAMAGAAASVARG